MGNRGYPGTDLKVRQKFKACARYFLSFFIFLPNDSPSKTEKCFLFHLKNSFCSRDIEIFSKFYSSFPHFSDSNGTNGSGIIFDVMNWLA